MQEKAPLQREHFLLDSPQSQLISSYTSVVNLNEGTTWKFIPTSIVIQVKCAKIEKTDMKNEIE